MQLLDPSERPEVTFFCANLLLSKVRSEWHKLSPEQATSMGTVIRYEAFLLLGGSSLGGRQAVTVYGQTGVSN
jgi:hypothetical protein